MISYAQNFEDAVLARAFTDRTAGFYVDIGAGHPVYDSVTKHFYDHGWRGLNVEPMPDMYRLLCEDRPRDTNVHAALSDHEGIATLFEGPEGNRGASTIERGVLATYGDADRFAEVEVAVTTFAALAREHGIDHADFVKIDAEGHEAQIVASIDWGALRPRVVVVEAVEPNSQVPSHEGWEPVLLGAGYECTLFDGVNRFYARSEDERTRATLSVPANVFDGIEPWRFVEQLEGAKTHVANVEQARRASEEYARSLEERVAALEAEQERGGKRRGFRRR